MRIVLLTQLGIVLTFQWCTNQGPASMLMNTREALLELNHVRKPNWVTRQLIFHHRLWPPHDHRTPDYAGKTPRSQTPAQAVDRDYLVASVLHVSKVSAGKPL